MKRISILIAGAMLAACSAKTEAPEGDLAKLQSRKDSLETVKEKVTMEISKLDEQIAELDTSLTFSSITTYALNQGAFNHYFSVYGNIEADKNVTLYPEISGVIEKIPVKEGQKVNKGQVLISMDGDVIRNQIQEVRTQYELAKTLFEKQERLWTQEKVGSEVQYLEAKNRKESLESNLETLKAQLAKTEIRAPFSGVVDRVFPKEGELVGPGSPAIRLVNMAHVYIEADVPESYLTSVNKGTNVNVEIPSINWSDSAVVTQVGDYINPNNRTFRIRVDLNNSKGVLVPNLMAALRINDYSNDSTIVVPNRLIQQTTDGRSFVFVYEARTDRFGDVAKKIISIGKSEEGMTEVISGLAADDVLVDRGSRSVKEGQKVTAVKLD
ncbi:MAG: efflux RND transporter periplasmic adaptor subunit [Bacteroidota bacterium]|nr:efflux RND transporter periplasmic adaptor subunit [Bacteroidota bacterium]